MSKEKTINSLHYKKMLILNPLCNLLFHVLFYARNLNFCPFLDGQIEVSNPLMHQTDVFAFQAKWNLMNFLFPPYKNDDAKITEPLKPTRSEKSLDW